MVNFDIFSVPKEFYEKMLEDIKNARSYIYLETFIYWDDVIGKAFKKALTQKAKEGVKIKLLLDSWSAKIPKDYFSELEGYGGAVRYFREIKYVLRTVSKNHERNHRKLLLIDGELSYIGSANISAEFYPNGRELVMRLNGDITRVFARTFLKNWSEVGNLTPKRIKRIIHRGFEIIQDIPSEIYKATENKYIKLIQSSRKEILIESPYFVPSRGIRKAFARAIRRGVKVKVLIPFKSDMYIADVVRNRYLGIAYRDGVDLYYYPRKTHAKLLIIDSKFFLLGSTNLDYRSFLHQYEINLIGRDPKMIKALKDFFNQGLREASLFNYKEWKRRSSLKKFPELFLYLIRRYV